jgi:hypothetical protein
MEEKGVFRLAPSLSNGVAVLFPLIEIITKTRKANLPQLEVDIFMEKTILTSALGWSADSIFSSAWIRFFRGVPHPHLLGV